MEKDAASRGAGLKGYEWDEVEFKKACATKLYETCTKTECTFKAETTCQDPCTEMCQEMCDRGADINCQHNCFGECVGACDEQCADADDRDTCTASCEATCDGECDAKCEGVDGDCYYHCAECCHGSCSAEANLDCQTECQQHEFESCSYDLQADCEASCDGDGALFCDGEFVVSGSSNLAACAEALHERGLLNFDLQVTGDVDVNAVADLGASTIMIDTSSNRPTTQSSQPTKAGGCRTSPGGIPEPSSALLLVGLAALLARRRRDAD